MSGSVGRRCTEQMWKEGGPESRTSGSRRGNLKECIVYTVRTVSVCVRGEERDRAEARGEIEQQDPTALYVTEEDVRGL